MSLLSPLRASSSRQTLFLLPALYSRRIAYRAQHDSSRTRAPATKGTTIQDAEKQLAEIQKAEAQRKKHGKLIDIHSMATPVVERTVDPPFQFSWLFRKEGRKYAWDRFQRFRLTWTCDMIKEGAIIPPPKPTGLSRLNFVNRLRPTSKSSLILAKAQNMYIRYNKAQASGDDRALREVASEAALTSALKLTSTGRKMEWNLIRSYMDPKLISVRIAPLDVAKTMFLGQVVIKFDTEQALTSTSKSGSQTRQQRVVENYVFERYIPDRGGWKIKQRLDDTPPFAGN